MMTAEHEHRHAQAWRAQLGAHPCEEERDGEEDDAQHVVGRALDVAPDLGGEHLRLRVEPFGVRGRREPVFRHRERGQRRVGVPQRTRREPRLERRLELLAEALLVEVRERRLLLGVGVDPLDERRDVDLGLRVREAGGARGLDSHCVDASRRLRLLAVPAVGLIAAPCRRDRREREQHDCDELRPVAPLRVAHGRPAASQGGSTCTFTIGNASSRIRSVRSIATGSRLPTPGW